MQAIERKVPVGYHRVLRTLHGFERYPRQSLEDNVKSGEAIVRSRSILGEFGDVDAMDDHPHTVPPRARKLFNEYRRQVNELVKGNLGLIDTAFRESPTLWNLPDDDLQDLAGAAQEELLRSAAHYDPLYSPHEEDAQDTPRIPRKFSTYAVRNMHFAMLNAAKDFQNIRIPQKGWEQYRAYWDARNLYADQQQDVSFDTMVVTAEFKRTHDRFPTAEELYESARKAHQRLIRDYAKLLMVMQPVSFDALLVGEPYRDDLTGEMKAGLYFMEDVLRSHDDVPEAVFEEIRRETITCIFDEIWPGQKSCRQIVYPRERQVLALRFGFDGQIKHTFEEVADYFGLTRERIRQIEAQALRKLRHPSKKMMLRDLLP